MKIFALTAGIIFLIANGFTSWLLGYATFSLEGLLGVALPLITSLVVLYRLYVVPPFSTPIKDMRIDLLYVVFPMFVSIVYVGGEYLTHRDCSDPLQTSPGDISGAMCNLSNTLGPVGVLTLASILFLFFAINDLRKLPHR